MAGDTPSLAQLIKDAIASDRSNLHTCLPAQVESYDDATETVAVVPCIKRKYENGDLVDLPVIKNVPVCFPRGGNAAIKFDIQAGDYVLLVFAERSVDIWKTQGGKVDPKDPRKHALSDAFAIPGGYPKSAPSSASALVSLAFGSDGGLTIENEAATYEIAPTGELTFDTGTLQGSIGALGKLSFTNSTAEYTATLIALIQAVMQSKVATSMGLQPLIPDATYAAELAKIQTFEE